MNKIKSILTGRYGVDQLNIVLLVIALIIIIAAFFTDREDYIILCSLFLGTYLYRACSKQHIVRYKENAFFMKLLKPIIKPVYIKFGRIKDKEHQYCHCPFCNQTISVKRQKGKVTIACPICKAEFKK
ncbi:hypothetical protein C8E03_101656 [Lachnotalea glycerini]|jgi:hypothetical protein|uniref:Zn-finger containing protein n=1 Tax=Lachnotalea glycerini TaxID=1763509 RepID=A0A255IPQ3_9FIRM|nr:hypothetical protein [Lachnotalea glycerini]PXV96023.1 hypothetical protein C8E03_101656 [Lachnotalea glycerini]RDY30201.1 hypothetical protein CG710_016020 [Lachnotalea glycerini]